MGTSFALNDLFNVINIKLGILICSILTSDRFAFKWLIFKYFTAFKRNIYSCIDYLTILNLNLVFSLTLARLSFQINWFIWFYSMISYFEWNSTLNIYYIKPQQDLKCFIWKDFLKYWFTQFLFRDPNKRWKQSRK